MNVFKAFQTSTSVTLTKYGDTVSLPSLRVVVWCSLSRHRTRFCCKLSCADSSRVQIFLCMTCACCIREFVTLPGNCWQEPQENIFPNENQTLNFITSLCMQKHTHTHKYMHNNHQQSLTPERGRCPKYTASSVAWSGDCPTQEDLWGRGMLSSPNQKRQESLVTRILVYFTQNLIYT